MLDEVATRSDFSSMLPAVDLVHIACHGVIDMLDPSQSGILLYDGSLQANSLIAQDLGDLGLVFLSACETANLGKKLVDEAISVATAFQVAGARNTIGTLWPISDQSGSEFATEFHRELRSPHERDTRSAAGILNKVVRANRDRYPSDPLRWAGYIHFGALSNCDKPVRVRRQKRVLHMGWPRDYRQGTRMALAGSSQVEPQCDEAQKERAVTVSTGL
jgi:CHAT domain-containing protein